MDISNMTTDELREYIKQLETAATENNKKITDLTAERDSFKDELDATKTTLTKTEADLSDAKKLNFTLARSVNTKPQQTTENILYDMFFGDKK